MAQLTQEQLTELRGELQDDPRGRGYAPYAARGQDSQLADLLNKLQEGIQVLRENVPNTEFDGLIDPVERAAMTSLQLQHLSTLTVMAEVDMGSPGVEGFCVNVIPECASSTARIRAHKIRRGSRAEQLFGTGVVMTHRDVGLALRPTRPDGRIR